MKWLLKKIELIVLKRLLSWVNSEKKRNCLIFLICIELNEVKIKAE